MYMTLVSHNFPKAIITILLYRPTYKTVIYCLGLRNPREGIQRTNLNTLNIAGTILFIVQATWLMGVRIRENL